MMLGALLSLMRRLAAVAALSWLVCFSSTSLATTIINDTWADGTRTDPASPTYSENGVDADFDTNIECAWFRSGTGSSLNPVGAGGPLRLGVGGSAAHVESYFTPEGSEINLVNSGDVLKVTWVFVPTGVPGPNTSQGFRIALVDAQSGRVTTDANEPSGNYPGYAIFGNMGTSFNQSTPFQLRERTGANDLLGTAGDWNALGSAGTSGNTGYANSTQYTNVWTLTRNGSGLDISVSMTGGNINGTGSMTVNFSDATPASFTYDTFGLRPQNSSQAASQFDTSLFKVEYIPIPEPSTLALVVSVGACRIVRGIGRRSAYQRET